MCHVVLVFRRSGGTAATRLPVTLGRPVRNLVSTVWNLLLFLTAVSVIVMDTIPSPCGTFVYSLEL